MGTNTMTYGKDVGVYYGYIGIRMAAQWDLMGLYVPGSRYIHGHRMRNAGNIWI